MSQEQKKNQKQNKKQAKNKEPKKEPVNLDDLPPREFVDYRLKLYEKFKSEEKKPEPFAIKITFPGGQILDAEAHVSTPYEVAKAVDKKMADTSVIARINHKDFWEMNRPLIASCSIEFFDFQSEEGQEVYWHSSAHMLGEAIELLYGSHLCIGPAVDNGFYYDVYLENDQVINESNFNDIERMLKKISSKRSPFERLEVTKEQALEMFKHNKFKVELISEKIKDGTICTVYRSGGFIDLCRGPHLPHTGKARFFMINKAARSFWKGDVNREPLQRVYGISFPQNKDLKQYKRFLIEAKDRHHKKIGLQQELFFFSPLSPGSCFFLPEGAAIYRSLMKFIRNQYWKRGFKEVLTPNIFSQKLWETSGHWGHYEENMFSFKVENETYSLKPMNCPSHCVMFGVRPRSHRELPLRIADFGALHRNEFSGALSGLTRVRRFQQDDAHIFCTPDQVETELIDALDFVKTVYETLKLDYFFVLSTKPEKAMGDPELWDKAETILKEGLENSGIAWKLNEGDGAFYGPKIDLLCKDSLNRKHQCATIQLDFQLPIRFDLKYKPEKQEKDKIYRPVMIHRAVLGSVERMYAILCEHFGGKWPFWLSPRQIMVVPISPDNFDYAKKIMNIFKEKKFYVQVELSGKKLNKKIRESQLAQFNFIFVVGKKEQNNGTINVRTRDNVVHGVKSIASVMKYLKSLRKERKEISFEEMENNEEIKEINENKKVEKQN
ncbi:threonine--tRNA ligase [Anaeramoeba flamelloides]|uniref:threonine--tRNA ligase n=1 Tax=Anaeramoeba flamelloides TaxID=1746091 RepID=A0ABQ8Z524_9EUKA|nr:threonine--tRNA ligase [Anaeramoeba flamelloides]